MQIAELCEQGGKPLDVSSSAALSHSLEAAVRAAPDNATAALIKSLVTRAMSEAEYLPAGKALSLSTDTFGSIISPPRNPILAEQFAASGIILRVYVKLWKPERS